MLNKLRQIRWFSLISVAVPVILTLVSKICVAHFLATDEPGDGAVYSQIAKNLLAQQVYSMAADAPFVPTLVRLPGYPLFLAAVYSIFGGGNDEAVRILQAVFDTGTCIIAAWLAWLWTEDEKRRRNALWTFILISLCPFIVIYAATLLTETLTTFLMAAMTLTATFALQSPTFKKSSAWWFLTGILSGAAVLLRPDSGLFAAGIGLTMVVSGLFLHSEDSPSFVRRLLKVIRHGAILTAAFILMLTPWTIRNYRVFGIFQPLAPAHGEMPGEFVPHGYERWLRTWVDDSRFTEPMLWKLGEKPIRIKQIPERIFDSDEERGRVAALLEQYNHPPGEIDENALAKSGDSKDEADNTDSGDDQNSQADESDEDDDDDENKQNVVKMTPEIDAEFAAIADERIERSPVRYYLFLPAKRAAALWFDSHSLYYPFGGQLSPISDLDYDENQQIWLPLFVVLMWIYTLLAVGGVRVLWRERARKNTLRWLIMIALMVLPRIAFFSTVENPEPRYVVELFVFAAIAGGFFLGQFQLKEKIWKLKKFSIRRRHE